jgi:WD40 repeat protein
VSAVAACPFPGLLPFGEEDAPFFFGRERETVALLASLEQGRFVAVIGVSGSGKSSLVRAGLRPELRLGSPPWRVAAVRPGGGPRRRLHAALERVVPGPEWGSLLERSSYGLVDGVGRAGLGPGERLLVVVDQFEEIFAYRRQGPAEAEEADLFVQQLLRASAEPGVPAYVMLTMRTDYLGHCALFRNLAEALNDGTYLVPRLTRQAQEEAIRSPQTVSGVEIEPGVVDLLLNAAEANRDELPVLQHLLKRLWEVWEARGATGRIGRADYEATGGWDEAIARDAESVLAPLTTEEREAARVVFQRVTEKGTGERPVRWPAPLDELAELTRAWVSGERLGAVVAAFRARDLLVWGEEERGGGERIDIPHECVTWRWPRLADWIDEEDRDARRLAFVAESARAGTPLAGSALEEARALRPRISEPWVGRYRLEAGGLRRWIDHSEREAERARRRTRNAVLVLAVAAVLFAALGLWAWQQKGIAQAQERKASEAEALAIVQADSARSARAEALDLAYAAALAEEQARVAQAEAERQAESAESALRRAVRAEGEAVARAEEALARAREGRVRLAALLGENSRAALESDPGLALLLALEAGYVTAREGEPRVPEAESALRRALSEGGGQFLSLSHGVGPIGDESGRGVAVSPDRRWLAVVGTLSTDGGWSSEVRLARLDLPLLDGEVLPGAREPIAFTPDGRWLATAAAEGGLLLWDLHATRPESQAPRLIAGEVPVQALAVSPDGNWLAAGPPTTLWRLSADLPAALPITLDATACAPGAVLQFSPDGRWLISGGSTPGNIFMGMGSAVRNACLTDLRAASPAASSRELAGHTFSVTNVEFSEDGRWLATYSRQWNSRASVADDPTIRVWDLSAAEPWTRPAAVLGDSAALIVSESETTAVLSPDGGWILTDGPRTGPDLRELRAPDRAIPAFDELQGTPVALGPASLNGSRWLVTVLRDLENTVLLWKIAPDSTVPGGWTLERQIEPLGRSAQTAVTRDQRWLAFGADNGTVELLDLADEDPRSAPRRFRSAGSLRAIALDRDGGWLGIPSPGGLRIWSLARDDGAADPVTLRTRDPILQDGRWLVAATEDSRRLNLWDLRDRELAWPTVVAEGERISPLALSRDGRRLVSLDRDYRLQLWSRDAGAAPPTLLWTPATAADSAEPRGYYPTPRAAFSPDGRWLAAGFHDGSVQLRDLTSLRATTEISHDSLIVAVGFSQDGRWLLTVDAGDRGCLWPVGSTERSAPARCREGVPGVRLAGPGRWVVAADSGRVRVWDLTAPDPWTGPVLIDTGLRYVTGVEVDPEGRWVVAHGDSLVLWRRNRLAGGTAASRLAAAGGFPRVRLSPDGRWLAAGGGWTDIHVWDLAASDQPVTTFARLSADVPAGESSLAFHPVDAGEAAVVVWRSPSAWAEIVDFADPGVGPGAGAPRTTGVHTILLGPGLESGEDGSKRLSPDGRWLIGRAAQTVLIHLDPQEIERLACTTAGRNLTHAEWRQYFPDQEYRQTCSELPAAPSDSSGAAGPGGGG